MGCRCRLKSPNPRELLTFTLKLLDLRDDVASANVLQLYARALAYPQVMRLLLGDACRKMLRGHASLLPSGIPLGVSCV